VYFSLTQRKVPKETCPAPRLIPVATVFLARAGTRLRNTIEGCLSAIPYYPQCCVATVSWRSNSLPAVAKKTWPQPGPRCKRAGESFLCPAIVIQVHQPFLAFGTCQRSLPDSRANAPLYLPYHNIVSSAIHPWARIKCRYIWN
jgi:hypothetical protein